MQWAVAHGYAERNPAGELIDGALPAMPKVNEHLRALPTVYPHDGTDPAKRHHIRGRQSSQDRRLVRKTDATLDVRLY